MLPLMIIKTYVLLEPYCMFDVFLLLKLYWPLVTYSVYSYLHVMA